MASLTYMIHVLSQILEHCEGSCLHFKKTVYLITYNRKINAFIYVKYENGSYREIGSFLPKQLILMLRMLRPYSYQNVIKKNIFLSFLFKKYFRHTKLKLEKYCPESKCSLILKRI